MYLEGLSKQDIFERVGHMNQIAGFKRYVLKEGKKEGVNAVDIWNGAGLYLTILPDRASDIASLTYNGKSLCWLSNLGVASPGYYHKGAYEWNNNFSGGMVASCGLTTAGVPCTDAGETLHLHGPVSNLPAEEVSCTTFWEGDKYFIQYSAKTYQAKPFAETLCLTRTITVEMGKNAVKIEDCVENLGFRAVPFMMVYHMNFGYPVLDEGSELYLTYDKRMPTSELAQATQDEIGTIGRPDDAYCPRAYNHTVRPDANGFAYAGILNEAIGLGATVKFKTDTLDQFNLWKCLQKRNYVVGLEPCNCRTWGRDKERENGALTMLSPFEAKTLCCELQIHTTQQEIEVARTQYGAKL